MISLGSVLMLADQGATIVSSVNTKIGKLSCHNKLGEPLEYGVC